MHMMNYTLQRRKLQLCGGRIASSKYYSFLRVLSPQGLQGLPFVWNLKTGIEGIEGIKDLSHQAALPWGYPEGAPCPRTTSLLSSYVFCLGGCLCPEPTALTSFRTWLKPHPVQGAASFLQSLSRLIILLYLSFPVVINTCHHDYW